MRRFGFALLILSVLALNAYADIPILGSAGTFAVLGATTVTNTGATTLNGNLGVSPGSAITDSGTITLNGTEYTPALPIPGNGVAALAQSNLTTAILALQGLAGSAYVLSTSSYDAGNITLIPGIYSTGETFNLLNNDTLTLDAKGTNNAFVFLVGSSLTTNTGSKVQLINAGANGNDVYWVEKASASLLGSFFVGNILAHTSITMGDAVDITCGSALANTGDVTMIHDTISKGCTGGVTITPSGGGNVLVGGGGITPSSVNVPEGGSTLLYLCFFLAPLGAAHAFRRRRSV